MRAMECIHRGPIGTHWADIGTPQYNRMFLYLLRSDADELLYVGITWNIKSRWQQHRQKKAWWPQVTTAEVHCITEASEVDAVNAARRIEWRHIHELQPLKNLHRPSIRTSKAMSNE